MRTTSLIRAAAAVGAGVLVVPLLATAATATASSTSDAVSVERTSAAAKHTHITLSGRYLVRDGKKFLSKSVIFEGFQFPYYTMSAGTSKAGKPLPCRVSPKSKDADKVKAFCVRHLDSRDYFFGRNHRPDALALAKKHWAVNTVRLNLNQAALDPHSKLWNAKGGPAGQKAKTYRQEIARAVAVAESHDLVVDLALFTSRLDAADDVVYAGQTMPQLNPPSPLPTAPTARAFATLAKMFGSDPDVLLEVYNEPGTQHYDTYLHGGGDGHVGVLPIIDAQHKILKNPVIVEGLEFSLAGFPFKSFGTRDVIFAVHPFLRDGTKADVDFARRFGNAAAHHPVLLTAWDASPSMGAWCRAATNTAGAALGAQLIRYVRGHHIGLTGFAFDVPFTITRDFTSTTPDAAYQYQGCTTTDAQGKVGPDKRHAGLLVQDLFNDSSYAP